MRRKNNWSVIVGPAVLLLLALLFSVSCVKEEFSIDKVDPSVVIEPGIATPIAYFDFSIQDIISESEHARVIINEDSVVSINYFDELRTGKAGELYTFDPVYRDFAFFNTDHQDIDLSSGDYRTEFSYRLPLSLSSIGSDADLDSVHFSLAELRISQITFPDVSVEMRMRIPGLTSQGEPFSTTLEPGTEEIGIDLAGYFLELTGEGDRHNLIDVVFELYYPQQNKILNAGQPYVGFNFDLNFREWHAIYGYLGKQKLEFPQNSIRTDFERYFPEGEIYFHEPVLRFRTRNSFDVPLAMGFSALNVKIPDQSLVSIKGSGVPFPPEYIYPAKPDNSRGPGEESSTYILDHENSNLRELTASKPERIFYNTFLEMNYQEQAVQNIIFSNSEFSMDVDLLLPFYGRARDLKIRDTLEINFSEFDALADDINRVVFKLYYENSYPADIHFQLYLAGSDLRIIDTLFYDSSVIEGTEPAESFPELPQVISGEAESSVPASEIERISQTRYIIAEAALSSVGDRNDVKIFSNQGLFMSLAAIFDTNANLEDF